MAEGARLVQCGTVGGTPVNVDVTNLGSAVPVKVVIGGLDYIATLPAGFPVRPCNTGAAIAESGSVIFSAGGTYDFLSAEATALTNAGFASLA